MNYTYKPLNRPIAVIQCCDDCTGIRDCTCDWAGGKKKLTEAEYDALFPPDTIEAPGSIPLGQEGTNA